MRWRLTWPREHLGQEGSRTASRQMGRGSEGEREAGWPSGRDGKRHRGRRQSLSDRDGKGHGRSEGSRTASRQRWAKAPWLEAEPE